MLARGLARCAGIANACARVRSSVHPGLERLSSSLGSVHDVTSFWRNAVVKTSKRMRPWLSEDTYRRFYGYGRLGYVPDYTHPRTFNEKVTWWLRQHRDPRLVERADKLAVRAFVGAKTPWVCLPHVYAASQDVRQLCFDAVPDVSVLKANHGWNQVRVLRRPFDEDEARNVAASWLRHRHGRQDWEWHFLDIPPTVYAEQFLGNGHGESPADYKVLVFNGRARFVQVFLGRQDRTRRVTFDRDWNVVPVYKPITRYGPPDVVEPTLHPPRPARLDAMLSAAEALAEDIPFVRADFYVVGDALYFSELTYFPAAGYVPFDPLEYDFAWGEMLDVGSPAP